MSFEVELGLKVQLHTCLTTCSVFAVLRASLIVSVLYHYYILIVNNNNNNNPICKALECQKTSVALNDLASSVCVVVSCR